MAVCVSVQLQRDKVHNVEAFWISLHVQQWAAGLVEMKIEEGSLIMKIARWKDE